MKPIRVISRKRAAGTLRLVVSSATSRRRYVVTQKRKWACSCKHWIFRRAYLRRKLIKMVITKAQFAFQVANFRCKHIEAVR